MEVKQMRSSFEIIAEILRVAKNGAKKTLLRIGNSYHTTQKGIQFLRNYQTMELLLKTRN